MLEPIGENLGKIAAIDNQDFLQTIKSIHFTVMCDITNPLLGEKGATYTFGPQKGATKEILEMLESGMTNFSSLAEKVMHKSAIHVPGAGAAGGLGWAFCQFFEAELKSGIETILDLYKFDEAVQKADLVISGEGHADGQSVDGKLLSGLGKTCGKYDVPLIAIVGGMSDGAEKLMDLGVSSIITTINDVMNIDYAMEHSYRLLKSASSRALRLIKAGMKMKP